MWESNDVSSYDLYWGPGGKDRFPVLKNARYIGTHAGGNNLKYEIEDGAKQKWVVKVADESQSEVAATRLIWAMGFKTETDYLVPRLSIPGVGEYKNARFELRPADTQRVARWSWNDNPFKDSREMRGLKIMMAMINNWDLKDENTAVLAKDGKLLYIVSDNGSSFGKLSDKSMSRANRSVNKPNDYAKANFIKGVNQDILELDYNGMNEKIMQGITVEDGRWLADRLLQLSDKQIEDAFRAANYAPQDVHTLTEAVKTRIAALDKATQGQTAKVR